jgi:hypothetical protein
LFSKRIGSIVFVVVIVEDSLGKHVKKKKSQKKKITLLDDNKG